MSMPGRVGVPARQREGADRRGRGPADAARPAAEVRAARCMRWGRSPAAGAIAAGRPLPGRDDDRRRARHAHLRARSTRARNALAHALSDLGVVEGDGVGIMCRNHRGFIESTFAVSKLGANSLYLNTAFAGPQLAEVVEREKPEGDHLRRGVRRAAGRGGQAPQALRRLARLREHRRPDDRRADRAGRPERRGAAVARGARRDPHQRHHRLAQGRLARPTRSRSTRRWRCSSTIPLKARQTAYIAAPLFHSWGFAHFTLGLILGSTYVLRRKFDPEAVPGRRRPLPRRLARRSCR